MTAADETRVEIGGYGLDLEGGRRVWVGKHEGSYFFRWENAANDPPISRIRLSAEAAEAMVTCFGFASGKHSQLAFALKDGGWQCVQQGLWAAADMIVEMRAASPSPDTPEGET